MPQETMPFAAIYAVRIQGEDGWRIYSPPVRKERLTAYLNERGLIPLKFIELYSLLEQRDDCDELKIQNVMNSMLLASGWAYDPGVELWRAPGELMLEPKSKPCEMESFTMLSEEAEAGWWEICFVINGKEYWISGSDLYDPINDYHRLIMGIIHGEDVRITVNEEANYTDISSYCKESGRIRLIIKLLGDTDNQEADILLEGKMFVEKFYYILLSFFNNKQSFENGWLMVSEEDFETQDGESYADYLKEIIMENGYPSYPDEEIERYLLDCSGL